MSWLKSLTSRRRERAATLQLCARAQESLTSQGGDCPIELEVGPIEQMLCTRVTLSGGGRRRRRRRAQEEEEEEDNSSLTHCQAQESDNCFYQDDDDDDDDQVTSQLTNEQQVKQLATRPPKGLKMSPPPTHTPRRLCDLNVSRLIVCCSPVTTCFLLLLTTSTIILQIQALATTTTTTSQRQYFEVEPEPHYNVLLNRDVRLRCLVRNRQGECAWLRNGRVLAPIAKKYAFMRAPEDGDCSLSISNASVSLDDGRWQCQVLSQDLELDSLQSREVNLVVLVAPEKPQIKNLSQGPAKLSLEESKQKIANCEMRGGNPAPHIDWFLDGKNVTKDASITIAGTGIARVVQSALRIDNIKRAQNGKNLTCSGVHPTGNQSISAELDVQYVPSVHVNQREFSIVEGSPLSVTCQVDANPPASLVRWRLVDGGGGGGAGSQRLRNEKALMTNKLGPQLEFHNMGREYNGHKFECLAQNAHGTSSPVDIRLNVLYAPILINTTQSESVSTGGEAHLACLFDGNPVPEIKWFYTDPLSRTAKAMQVDPAAQLGHPFSGTLSGTQLGVMQQLGSSSRTTSGQLPASNQMLSMRNVTYRNEGDYYCEARSSINGHASVVVSSTIGLDVYGEPQFISKPSTVKAIQGNKADLALTFCSDPQPQRVHWQFGSNRLEVRTNSNVAESRAPALVGPPGGDYIPTPVAVLRRFQVHPLQNLQRRESAFSKTPTCFEATLTLLEPELNDARDYHLIVDNQRGSAMGVVRLTVATPLSPALMISSAFVFICVLFILSLLFLFALKKRSQFLSRQASQSGGAANANGNGSGIGRRSANGRPAIISNGKLVMSPNGTSGGGGDTTDQQQIKGGLIQGAGSGLANGSSNPLGNGAGAQEMAPAHDEQKQLNGLMSMASSENSCNDQRQLLACNSSSSSDRNSSNSSVASSSTTTTAGHAHFGTLGRGHAHAQSQSQSQSTTRRHNLNGSNSSSTGNDSPTQLSTPRSSTPMNHISVDDELQLNGSYQATESVTRGAQLGGGHSPPIGQPPLIYANIDYCSTTGNGSTGPTGSGANSLSRHSKVGATIAMMNSLAAAAAINSPASPVVPGESGGALSDAINQQLGGSSRAMRRPGPPKPPKPSIQLRSRFYQQVQQANTMQANNVTSSPGDLVMIGGSPAHESRHSPVVVVANGGQPQVASPSSELVDEYSRFAFAARAEL